VSGSGRRLSAERDLWQAVWKQMETFLDRIDSARSEDEPHATTMCALLPVFGVIEGARERSSGYRIGAALSSVPGGANDNGTPIASVSATQLTSKGRIPGSEDCEFAVAGYAVPTDDSDMPDDPPALMTRSIALDRFRDAKQGDVTLRTPTYEFGDLGGVPMIVIEIGDGGLFPRDEREKAMNGDEFHFTSWKSLRDARVAKARTSSSSARSLSAALAEKLKPENYPPPRVDLIGIGGSARASAQRCRGDRDVLEGARAELSDAGVSDDVIGAMAAAGATMHQQSVDFDWVADQLSSPTVETLDYSELLAVKARLAAAEGAPGASGLPLSIEQLDAAAAKAMNEAIEQRIGYPDGPLRQLRMLQWTLRFFWEHRKRWMAWRHGLVLGPLYSEYMGTFTRSLELVLAGQRSGLPLPDDSILGRDARVGATEIALAGVPDLSTLRAGQMVLVRGGRPTAAPVVDTLFDGKKLPPLRLKVPPLAVSVETGKDLPGVPGLVTVETPLRDHYRRLDDDELRRGTNREGRAADGIVQALVAHRSRLALVLGDAGGGGRPAPPAVARPYAGIARFDLEGTVAPGANQLLLKSLPPSSASGNGQLLPIARPGEMLLLYGLDEEGEAWQTALEVDRVRVTTAAEARADEEAGATPPPPCCADDEQVMIVHVRNMQVPYELHGAFLHRSFAGFAAPSLFTGIMLPEGLDPDTPSGVQVGASLLRPHRDPELAAAVRVFDEWMPKETA
jgi:hypothetical protein